ncbi:Non-specific lipid-transfer protein 1 [Apostasia shenzhenica]|uniref:Non-specific lipid-transfer protein n=1 Tax=Apostasia shenzhenica TaxID=1088818 RepID=A0A2I0A8J4_9ASPA|nr:Non-specific lipid-transfer protein 1 [Apostasia shenzhenica]
MARAPAMAVMAAVLALAAVLLLPRGAAVITCLQVDIDLLPCLSYIRTGGTVPGMCCKGVAGLVAAARTTADRRSACNCLKSLAHGASNDEISRAEQIPAACNISIPYKISPDTDCNK